MSLFRNPSKGPRRRPQRTRADREPQHLPVELLLALVAAVAVWLTILGLQGEFAGAAKRKLPAPRPLSPANGASVQAVPSFSWQPVRRAVRYEFQLAADPAFESVVNGDHNGSFFTRNTSASFDEALADGDYYWRARAIAATGRAGRWSTTRSIHKRWSDAPVLLGPADGGTITYPRTPLVLRWARVPGAYKYVVRIATDPSLAQSALGARTPSVETSGTAFALPGALASGRYYWAVTPLDAEKHPGRRSPVHSFVWNWPTRLNEATQLAVDELDPVPGVADPHQRFDPQLRWAPIAGASRYQVEISTALERDGGDRSFPAGSIVCCSDATTGTALSPTKILANNTGSGVPGDPEQFGYWWRVRAVDADGNAGAWNFGPPFDKTYPMGITGLHVRDNLDDAPTDRDPGTPGLDTWSPAIVWNPVQGASSYELQVVPYVPVPFTSTSVCNWSSVSTDTWDVVTAANAWTPLGNPEGRRPTGVLTDLTPSNDGLRALEPSTAYCARVRARRDRDARNREVVNDWTTIGDGTQPAFRYVPPPAPSGGTLQMSDADYLGPLNGQLHAWMPLFTWQPVDGARGYFVVVARDRDFTKIVDLAFTNVPAYAPRRNTKPWTYADETTSYWWAVVPTAKADGDIAPMPPTGNTPRRFVKSSSPPQASSPAGGVTVTGQPTFRWKPALGARSYTLQVAQDPSFGTPLVSVTTDSTGYTTSATLPADTALYWRVRANDEIGTALNWSRTERFRRKLPVPAPVSGNPVGGETIPVLAWTPVQGAVSYGMHVEQVDGTKRDFTMRSTAFTPVIFYGTGVWHWQVRANFPAGTRSGVVSGGYFTPRPFTRHIATPTGLRASKANRGALLAWDPAKMAKGYRVQVSDSDSFSRILEQETTDNASWAPRMLNPAFDRATDLYWRVAVVDEGHNLGGWAARRLRSLPSARIHLRGRLRTSRAGTVRVTVTGRNGRRLAGAVVRVQGAGVMSRPRRTDRRGTARLRLTPRARGVVRFSAEKAGYSPARAKLRVR
jgi:hypothetical protein